MMNLAKATVLSLLVAFLNSFEYFRGGGYNVKYCIVGKSSAFYDAKNLDATTKFFQCVRTKFHCGENRFYSCQVPCNFSVNTFLLADNFRISRTKQRPNFQMLQQLEYQSGDKINVSSDVDLSTMFADDVKFGFSGPGEVRCSSVDITDNVVACTLDLSSIDIGNFTISIAYGDRECSQVQHIGIVLLKNIGAKIYHNGILVPILLSILAFLLIMALLLACIYWRCYRKRSVRPLLLEESREDKSRELEEDGKTDKLNYPNVTEENK